MKQKYIVLALFLVLFVSSVSESITLFIGNSVFAQGGTSSSWLDPAWSNRQAITVDNSHNANSLTDYQLRFNVTYADAMKSDFSDLRFTSGDGVTLVPFWLESYVPSVSAVVWVKVPNVAASGTTTLYMYYGNPAATSISNGKGTFDFFDDFENPASGWMTKQSIPHTTADATAAVYNGKLYVFGGYDKTATDILDIVYEYNPQTNTWAEKTNMPTARWGEIAVQYNGKIYVFGGQTNPAVDLQTGSPQNINKYSNNPLTTIPQYGALGNVHPDVVYFPEGQDGYKYWLTYTPYNYGALFENPSIVRSNDGLTWTDAGITNPVIPPGTAGAFNDLENPDPDFLYVADYNKWFMVWDGGNAATDSRKIALVYSTDGKTWTQYNGVAVNGNTDPVILSGDDSNGQAWERLGSVSKVSVPTLYYENGVFYLYYAEEASGNNRGQVGLATFTWNDASNSVTNLVRNPNNPIINLPEDSTFKSGIGHLNIVKSPDGSQYWMYGVRETVASSVFELVQLSSTTKTTWNDDGVVLSPAASGSWDGLHIYRSAPVVDQTGKVVLFNNAMQLYYSAWTSTSVPKIGLASVIPYYGVFGNPHAGQLNVWDEAIQMAKFHFDGATGTYTGSISVYFSSVASAPNNKAVVGIYDQNLQKIAASTETVGLTTGWQTFNLTGTFSLVADTDYYLVSHAPLGNQGAFTDGNQQQSSWKTSPYTGTLPASLSPVSGQENGAYAIFCTYTNPAMNTAAKIPPLSLPVPHTNEVYDPSTDTWTTKSDVPADIAYQGLMGVLFGNQIHLFYKNYHYVYFPENDSYVRKADVPTQRTWGTCAVVDNKIYVIGGYSYSEPTGASNVNEVYDPATDTWTTNAPLPVSLIGTTRENPVIDGKIIVTHGLDALAGNFHVETYVYNPATNAWVEGSSAGYPRDGVACGVIADKLYVVGGRADIPGPYGLDYNEVYDPSLDNRDGSLWAVSSSANVYADSSAKYQGNYGLLINDNYTSNSQYTEHKISLDQVVVDLDWDITSDLGIGSLQPQGRILFVDPSLAQYGTLYLYNDAGTPSFKWYTGAFTTLQSANWNTWYHISIVFAGSSSKVIINGVTYLVTAASVSGDRIRLDTSNAEVTRAYFDNVNVHKYTAVEPTVAFGLAESQSPQATTTPTATPTSNPTTQPTTSPTTQPADKPTPTATPPSPTPTTTTPTPSSSDTGASVPIEVIIAASASVAVAAIFGVAATVISRRKKPKM
jgi:hypothetical protein